MSLNIMHFNDKEAKVMLFGPSHSSTVPVDLGFTEGYWVFIWGYSTPSTPL